MTSTITVPSEPIGKYEIRKILGQGAMGLVYQAFDTEIERVVALKTLHKHLLEGEQGHDFSQRFLQEAKAAARCLHPNIVTVFDYGIHESTPYLVMEYVEGAELKEQLLSDKVIPFESTLNIITQTLDALGYAHERGVVHRDIKPANIMIMSNDYLKVSDFGVARIDNSDLTSTGMMIGTPNYMAPESVFGLPVDNRSDLYSVGVLLFELLTKERPDKSKALESAIAPIDACEHLDFSQKAQLKPILLRALQNKPEDRYQKAEEFRDHLNGITIIDDDEPKTVIFRPQPLAKPEASSVSSNQAAQTGVGSQIIHSEVHALLETSLTRFVGPSAKALIKKYSKKTDSLDDLSRCLSLEIPDEEEQQEFLHSLETSGIREISLLNETGNFSSFTQVTNNTSASKDETLVIDPQKMQTITSELAFYVGPLASRLIKKALRKSSSLEQFYQALASAIPDSQERASFLAKIQS